MKKRSFTLVEIMIVVAIIGLLAAIAIPNFMQARAASREKACLTNLSQIDGAIVRIMFEEETSTVPAADEIAALLKTDDLPECPAGGEYVLPGDANGQTTCPNGHALD